MRIFKCFAVIFENPSKLEWTVLILQYYIFFQINHIIFYMFFFKQASTSIKNVNAKNKLSPSYRNLAISTT